MEQYAPLMTAVFTGVAIPFAIWLFSRLKKALNSAVGSLKDEMVKQAETVAQTAANAAITVADAAKAAAIEAEGRITSVLDRNSLDVKTALARLDEMNGKIAATMAQQARDHDQLVWVLGRLNQQVPKEETL